MIKYLLLRNNKQSGPYTLEELRTKGLKAYDLVWIDGKSAAWRYPSEVEELKVFAPVVEEQPFDRFYKKPVPEVHPIFALPEERKAEKEITSVKVQSIPVIASIKKNVYVTLPVSRATSVPTDVEKVSAEKDRRFMPAADVPLVIKQEQVPIPESRQGRRFADNNFVVTEEKISQPAEQKSHRSEEKNTHHSPVGVSNKRIVKIFVVSIGIIGLLMAGVLIGMYIDKPKVTGTLKSNALSPVVTEKPAPVLNKKDSVVPIVDNKTLEALAPAGISTTETAKNTAEPAVNTSIQATVKNSNGDNEKRKQGLIKTKQDDNTIPAKVASVKDSSEPFAAVQKRESVHRTDGAIDKDAVKTNISTYVSTSVNKFSVGAFGGIDNLQISVSNRSLYPLDMVVVEVQYIQANKKVFKTENIYFRNIGAGAVLMQEAPKSSRGVKIEYKITLIDSKELGLSYSGT